MRVVAVPMKRTVPSPRSGGSTSAWGRLQWATSGMLPPAFSVPLLSNYLARAGRDKGPRGRSPHAGQQRLDHRRVPPRLLRLPPHLGRALPHVPPLEVLDEAAVQPLVGDQGLEGGREGL